MKYRIRREERWNVFSGEPLVSYYVEKKFLCFWFDVDFQPYGGYNTESEALDMVFRMIKKFYFKSTSRIVKVIEVFK